MKRILLLTSLFTISASASALAGPGKRPHMCVPPNADPGEFVNCPGDSCNNETDVNGDHICVVDRWCDESAGVELLLNGEPCIYP